MYRKIETKSKGSCKTRLQDLPRYHQVRQFWIYQQIRNEEEIKKKNSQAKVTLVAWNCTIFFCVFSLSIWCGHAPAAWRPTEPPFCIPRCNHPNLISALATLSLLGSVGAAVALLLACFALYSKFISTGYSGLFCMPKPCLLDLENGKKLQWHRAI